MTMLLGLKQRVEWAEAVQVRINNWLREQRFRATGDHERLMKKTLRQANLMTLCRSCGRVMDTAINHINCEFCGSADTCSPYYC